MLPLVPLRVVPEVAAAGIFSGEKKNTGHTPATLRNIAALYFRRKYRAILHLLFVCCFKQNYKFLWDFDIFLFFPLKTITFVLPKEKIFLKSPCKWSLISVYISKSFFLPSRVHLKEEQNHYGSRLLPRHVRETCQVSWAHCEWCWDSLLCLSRNQLKIAVFEWGFHAPLFCPWQGHLCFLVHVSLVLVPGRMERKQWGKSLLNLLLKTKVSSCLLYWSTGTNQNSSPLRSSNGVFWNCVSLVFSLEGQKGSGKSVAVDQSCWHCKTQLFF